MKTEITEGNKLIAEFMGIKEIESSYDSYGHPESIWYTQYLSYRTPTFSRHKKSIEYFINKSRFNCSWDWLIPVIENIEMNCKCDVHIYGHYNWKEPNRCVILDWENTEIVSKSSNSKIQCAFDAVIEFVEWHNSQNML